MDSLVGLAIFVLVNSAIGFRLLLNGFRRGGGATLSCGFGFVFIGLLGHPMTTFSGIGALTVGEIDLGLGAAGAVFTAAGLAAFYSFTLIAFRPSSRWAWGMTIGATLLLTLSAFGQIGALGAAPDEMSSMKAIRSWSMLTGVLSTICYAWSGIEGISEWRRARKRVALGLTDPMTANRIFLWGLHGLCVTSLNVLLMALSLQSVVLQESGLVQTAFAVIALIGTTTITLAFFPTRAWARWVNAHAPVREA